MASEMMYRVGSPVFPGHNADRIQEIPKQRDFKKREQANRGKKKKGKRESRGESGQGLVDTRV